MTRLADKFSHLRSKQKKAFVSFVTAGDPEVSVTVPSMHALVSGGVDVLELGIPFSDPEAEGPSIQRSSERALANGVRFDDVLAMVKLFREDDTETPVVLMGYLNTVLRIGYEEFSLRAAKSGVDGLIMVNLPPEEAAPLKLALTAHGIDLILLVAPTTTPNRARRIVNMASGFVYYVSLKGVTGASHLQSEAIRAKVVAVKSMTNLPVMVGFGIKDPEMASQVAAFADGVVVGSALVDTMARLDNRVEEIPDALRVQAQSIRTALDQSST
ncbi:MAG: tryptophan synthase subunit alpha [Pseudomonadales bacterium]|nr:tryptophan synthase subunit alpha [Pseudomonadales bacterium]